MSDTTTKRIDPEKHRFAEPRYFDDFEVGETFYIPSRTMTDALFAAFQLASGDNHPIHYDREYCRVRGHKGLLAHGLQVLIQTAAGAGIFPHVIGDSLMGFFPWEQGAPGSTGCLIKSEGYSPSQQGTLVYFTVPSIENTLGNIVNSGGKTILEKMNIGEHGFIAHFEDCEGNRVALHRLP